MEANIVRFGELYEIPSSNGLSRPSAVRGEGFKMINMGELFANNIISNIPMERVQMSDKEQEKFFVKEGDLLFARQSLVAEGAGKCSIVKNFSEPTTFESHLIRVRLNKRSCDSWFYYYLFQLKSNPIKAIINQCAQAGIRGSELVRVKVPHPPLPTQQKIASILSAYDNLIQNYKKQIEDLQTTASELYKEWFVRFRFPGYKTAQFENGIPVGWTVERILDVFNTTSGGTPSRAHEEYYQNGIYPWIKTGELLDAPLMDTEEHITQEAVNNSSAKVIPENSLVMAMYAGETIGKMAFNKMKVTCNQACCVFLPKEGKGYYRFYLFHFLKASRSFITGLATGAAQQNLSQIVIGKLKIVLPSEELLLEFEDKQRYIFELIDKKQTQITNLTQQRDLLLPRLMSGKIEVE